MGKRNLDSDKNSYRDFNGTRYTFDSVCKKKSWAVKGAKRMRDAGQNVRIVTDNSKNATFKYKLYVVGRNSKVNE